MDDAGNRAAAAAAQGTTETAAAGDDAALFASATSDVTVFDYAYGSADLTFASVDAEGDSRNGGASAADAATALAAGADGAVAAAGDAAVATDGAAEGDARSTAQDGTFEDNTAAETLVRGDTLPGGAGAAAAGAAVDAAGAGGAASAAATAAAAGDSGVPATPVDDDDYDYVFDYGGLPGFYAEAEAGVDDPEGNEGDGSYDSPFAPDEVYADVYADVDLYYGGAGAVEASAAAERAGGATDAAVALTGAGDAPLDGSADAAATEAAAR